MFSDRERERVSLQAAKLARDLPPPSFFLSLARQFSEGRISALRYDPVSGRYRYIDLSTKEEHEVPASQFQERAAMVCRTDEGELEFRPIPTLPGQLGAQVKKSACYPHRPVGVIHTHPAGATWPSPEDMMVFMDPDLEVMCVAGKDRHGGKDYYPSLCFYRYDWVDREDVYRISRLVDEKLRDFVFRGELPNVLRIDVYDKDGVRFTYVFPPPLASRYLVDKLRSLPEIRNAFDVDFRVWDEKDVEGGG